MVASSNPGHVYISLSFPKGRKMSTASIGRNSGAALAINKGAKCRAQLKEPQRLYKSHPLL